MRRAATTFVSLKTRRSPGRRRLGKSRMVQSRKVPGGGMCAPTSADVAVAAERAPSLADVAAVAERAPSLADVVAVAERAPSLVVLGVAEAGAPSRPEFGSRTSSRLADRSASGVWAIRSGGRL